MRKLVVTVALLVFALASAGQAQTPAKPGSIEELVGQLSDAYTARALGRLDTGRPYAGTVRISIENSLGENNDKDHIIVRSFRSLQSAERWLRSRERGKNGEDGPARGVKPLKQCGKGVCSFDFDSGILHNNLYLKKVSYGLRRGKPYLKTIYLLDGD